MSARPKAAIALETSAGSDGTPPLRWAKWRRLGAPIGLSLLVVSAAFPMRFEVPGGHTASLFDLAVAVCAAQLALMALARTIVSHPPRRIILGMLIPTLLTVASVLWSDDFVRSLLTAASWIEAIIVVTFVTVSLGHESPSQVIKWIVRLGLALLAAPILMYLHVRGFDPPAEVNRLSGDFFSYYTRFSHPFLGRSNNLATLLVILYLPLAYWAEKYHRYRWATLIIGVAILLTLSRGVILALVISAVFLTMRTRGWAAKLGRCLIIPFCIALPLEWIIIKTVPVVADNIAGRASAGGVEARQGLLSDGVSQLTHNLWIGAGAGAGESIHNTFLQQLVYFGLPLGLVVVASLLQVPRWFFTVPSVNPLSRDLARAAGCGVVAGYLTFLTQSSFEGTLLRPVIFLCFGLCVALAQAGLRLDGQVGIGRDPLKTLEADGEDTESNLTGTEPPGNTS